LQCVISLILGAQEICLGQETAFLDSPAFALPINIYPRPRPKSEESMTGKRVAGAVYVHRSAVSSLEDGGSQMARAEACAGSIEWNVAKIEKKSISLLLYESFDDAPFPALLGSTKIDLSTGETTFTDYRRRANPPILHRKELLLPPDDPRLPVFRALTAAAEERGLFKDSNRIGTRKAWEARIAETGLVLRGHRLVEADEEHFEVVRHKTAIVRRDLSQPMQLMMRFGMVRKERSIFDFGCGQGEDVAALASQGFSAFGWDPHHAPHGPRAPADVVNLGFVINVIEDPRERVETVKAAWSFAQQALCVSVMLQGKYSTAGQKPYRDGYLTSRGTFQKYFEQQELQSLVAGITGEKPMALAPGVIAVFKDKDLEQEVLLRRHSRAFVEGALPRPPIRERIVVARPELRERIAPAIEALHEQAILLGRVPDQEEATAEALACIAENRVSWKRTLDLLRDDLAADERFHVAGRLRREDLLVHLALMQFPGAPKYRHLPKSIQSDLKVFFKSHSAAMDESRRLLFGAGDRDGVRADVEKAVAEGFGGLRGTHHFRFRSDVLSRLPPRLRILVGSAEVLQGGVESSDFVDIDLEAPRIVMVTCDDVDKPVPFVVERTFVDLGRLKVSTDRREPETTPIYFKSKYMRLDDAVRERQVAFETSLTATGLFEPDRREPGWEDVAARLHTGIDKN
jgi:DNA phosphorothioation-associated putative methyltransferase